ncbi:hypothetical protein [Arenibaculum sp.]|jgi:hypothetical protein|uniref:hypothetical protein n=1 Tax=Arenibaculum sp. TaxID=2865862 RepID=UPI002E118DED|nr:hypothetical protein [Arenibaculum sp.]
MSFKKHAPPPTRFGTPFGAGQQARPASVQPSLNRAPPAPHPATRTMAHQPPAPASATRTVAMGSSRPSAVQLMEGEDIESLGRGKRKRVPPGTSELLREKEAERWRQQDRERIEKKRESKARVKKEIEELKKKKKAKNYLINLKEHEYYGELKDLSIYIGNGTGTDVTAVGITSGKEKHAAAQRPQHAQNLRATERNVIWHQNNPGRCVHAEMWLLYLIVKSGKSLTHISAERELCERCRQVLDAANVKYDKAYIGAATDNWYDPWAQQGEENPYGTFDSYDNGRKVVF